MNEEKWKKSWAIKLDYELFLNSVEMLISKKNINLTDNKWVKLLKET